MVHNEDRARLCVAALLVANQHEGDAIDGAETAHDGRVVQARTVAMQLHKLVRDVQRNVQERWAVGMPRDLQPLRGRQPRIRIPPQLRQTPGFLNNQQ